MAERKYWINPYSLRNQISLSFLVIGFAVVFLLIITGWQVYNLLNYKSRFNQSRHTIQIHLSNLQSIVAQTNLALQNHLIDQNLDYEVQRNRSWQVDAKKSMDSLDLYKTAWTADEVKEKYEKLIINLKKMRTFQDEIARLIDQSAKNTPADTQEEVEFRQAINPKTLFESKLLELINIVQDEFRTLQDLQTKDFVNQEQENQKQLTQFWTIQSILLILLFALIIYLAATIRTIIKSRVRNLHNYVDAFNHGNIPDDIEIGKDEFGKVMQDLQNLGSNLKQMQQLAATVGRGEFDTDIRVFDYEGELGKSFAEMHDGLLQVAVRDQQRNWTNEGIALFGSILREYNDPQSLYDELISNLVKYIMANQGGIFILSESLTGQASLELRSVYAYDRKRFVEKSVKPGQGLVGQVWLEKEVLYLEESSDDFIQISSGLGKANPRSLLIVPMISNESEVLGAIELASFKTFAEYEIEFVKRVGEMIVSAISSLKNSEKTRLLLDEAQKATEQLRKQEQEMRLNMTQLMATQEEMLRNQAELSGQTFAINTTLAFVEFDVNDIIINANEIFLTGIGMSLDALKGQSYSTLIDGRSMNLFDYQKFWQNLREGQAEQREIRISTPNGNEMWYNATFTPIKNNQGEIYKIIKLGVEVTDQKRLNYSFQSQLAAIYRTNAIIEYNLQGYIMDANELYLRMMEYKLEEIKGKHQNIFIPESDRQLPENTQIWGRLAQGESILGIFKRIDKNGKTRWIRGSYSAIADLDGKPFKIFMIAQDISHEKEVEDEIKIINQNLKKQQAELQEAYQKLQIQESELREHLQKNEQIQTQMTKNQLDLRHQLNVIQNSLAWVEYDPEGKIVNANESFLKLSKYRLSEIIGLSYSIFLRPETKNGQTNYQDLWHKILENNLSNEELKFVAKDGSELWLTVIFNTLKDSKNKVYKVMQLALQSQAEQTIAEVVKN
jgi:PAS domain S-box-containing protein